MLPGELMAKLREEIERKGKGTVKNAKNLQWICAYRGAIVVVEEVEAGLHSYLRGMPRAMPFPADAS